ncbi:MAG TPA: hypothetical protein VGG43_10700 [Acidimicrobiales bacterium]
MIGNLLPGVGEPARANHFVVNPHATCTDDQPSTGFFLDFVSDDRLDVDARLIGDNLDLSWKEPKTVAQWFGNDHATCLVNRCSHACEYASTKAYPWYPTHQSAMNFET